LTDKGLNKSRSRLITAQRGNETGAFLDEEAALPPSVAGMADLLGFVADIVPLALEF
jgi:hypothetical protein